MNTNITKYFVIPDVKEFFKLLECSTYLTDEQKIKISNTIVKNVCNEIAKEVDLENAPHDYDGIHDDLFTEHVSMAMEESKVLQSDYFEQLWSQFYKDMKGLPDSDDEDDV